MAYLIDSDVLIDAKNFYYGFDFCPAFWDWLIESNKAGKVFSIEKVRDELIAGADPLADWAKQLDKDFFLPPDPAMLPALGKVSAWATTQKYEPAAVTTFLQVADYYLVAYALEHKHIIVTREIPSATVKRIKIPDACIGLGIKCMSPFEMLRLEHARFLLKK